MTCKAKLTPMAFMNNCARPEWHLLKLFGMSVLYDD